MSNGDIIKKYTKLSTKINEDNKIRLLLTIHTVIDVKEKDFNNLTDGIMESKLKCIKNLEWLGII